MRKKAFTKLRLAVSHNFTTFVCRLRCLMSWICHYYSIRCYCRRHCQQSREHLCVSATLPPTEREKGVVMQRWASFDGIIPFERAANMCPVYIFAGCLQQREHIRYIHRRGIRSHHVQRANASLYQDCWYQRISRTSAILHTPYAASGEMKEAEPER